MHFIFYQLYFFWYYNGIVAIAIVEFLFISSIFISIIMIVFFGAHFFLLLLLSCYFWIIDSVFSFILNLFFNVLSCSVSNWWWWLDWRSMVCLYRRRINQSVFEFDTSSMSVLLFLKNRKCQKHARNNIFSEITHLLQIIRCTHGDVPLLKSIYLSWVKRFLFNRLNLNYYLKGKILSFLSYPFDKFYSSMFFSQRTVILCNWKLSKTYKYF